MAASKFVKMTSPFEQGLNDRDGVGRGLAEIGAEHRLASERDGDLGRGGEGKE